LRDLVVLIAANSRVVALVRGTLLCGEERMHHRDHRVHREEQKHFSLWSL
jgi:hypothetical protein